MSIANVADIPELRSPPAPALPATPEFICGLDLGCVSDYTALAIVEKTVEPAPAGKRPLNRYAVRYLQRWLGVSYPDIADALKPILSQLNKPALVVDSTGVGVAVVSILRRASLPVSRLTPVTITGGAGINESKIGGWNVGKRELVSVAQSALQGKRLVIAPALKEAKTLRAELQNFKAKISISATESFEAWRENDHDDLVLAICLALWVGERPIWRLTASNFFV